MKAIIACLVFTLALASLAAASAPLVSLWKLDELSGSVAEDSVSGFNGIYVNDPPKGKQPHSSESEYSVRLNDLAKHYIRVVHRPEFQSDKATISLWINPRSTLGKRAIFSKDYTSSQPGDVSLILEDGRVHLSVDGLDYKRVSLSGSTVVPTFEWTHVLVSFGPHGLRLYLNGNLEVIDGSWKAGLLGNNHDFFFGARTSHGQPQDYFFGLMDDIAFFDGQVWPDNAIDAVTDFYANEPATTPSPSLAPGQTTRSTTTTVPHGCPSRQCACLDGYELRFITGFDGCLACECRLETTTTLATTTTPRPVTTRPITRAPCDPAICSCENDEVLLFFYDTTGCLTCTCSPAIFIQGVVTQNGVPVGGAMLTFSTPYGFNFFAMTNPDGSYEVKVAPSADPYDVSVQAGGDEFDVGQVSANAGTVTFDISLGDSTAAPTTTDEPTTSAGPTTAEPTTAEATTEAETTTGIVLETTTTAEPSTGGIVLETTTEPEEGTMEATIAP